MSKLENNHITKLGFRNYRVFDSTKIHEIELKPITFITGANSSGKSSIFKAFMLLEENRNVNDLLKLMFFSGNHVLGSLKTIQNKNEEHISFSICRKNIHKEDVTIHLEYNKDGLLKKASIYAHEKELITLDYKPKYKYTVNANLQVFSNFNLFKENIQFNDIYDNNVNTIIVFVTENWLEWEKSIKANEIDAQIRKITNDYIEEENRKLEDERKKMLVDVGFNDEIQITDLKEDKDIQTLIDIDNYIEEEKQTIIMIAQSKQEEIQKEIEETYKNISSESEQERINKFVEEIQNNIINHQLGALFNLSKIVKKSTIFKDIHTQLLEDIKKVIFKFSEDESINDFAKFLPNKVEMEERYKSKLSEILFDKNIHKVFYKRLIGDYLDMFFLEPAPFFHIPVDRGRQKRIITFSNQNDVLENALLSLKSKNDQVNNGDNRTKEQRDFIHYWFHENRFDIGFDFRIKEIEGKSVFFRVYESEADFNNVQEEKGKTLADLGLGISQLMPIILSCINTDNKGKTIFIEEPETNLHPKFQSLLAEMFVDAADKFQIQFIIETHSEYLIRKMQELVANKKIDKEDSIIYYFRSSKYDLKEVESRFEKIEFKEEGIIDYHKFGEGFYDTDYSLEFGLLNMQARTLFKKMYDDLEGKTEKERIEIIGNRIDHYTKIQDLSKWEKQLKEEIPNFERLNQKTKYYLTSAYFFMGMFDKSKVGSAESNHIDFAPIVVQLGRAVETEMTKVFQNVIPIIPPKDLDFNYMQGKIEKNPTNNNIKTAFESKINNVDVFISFVKSATTNLDSIRNTSTLLGVIRTYRNSAAHENHTTTGLITYEILEKYHILVIEFLKKWCSHLKPQS